MKLLLNIRSNQVGHFRCLVCLKDTPNTLANRAELNENHDVLICSACDYSTHLLTIEQKSYYLQQMRIQNEVKDAA